MSEGVVPCEIEVEVVGRRLSGVLRPHDEVVIGPSNLVTYDYRSITPGYALYKENQTPRPTRLVSPAGQQIDIQAAAYRDTGRIRVVSASDVRFVIGESLVYENCTGAAAESRSFWQAAIERLASLVSQRA